MISMTLYRYKVDRQPETRDPLGIWFFWQRSVPYKLRGILEACAIVENFFCEVYVIGGVDCVYRGMLEDVPASMRSYLHEVRLIRDLPHA